MRNVMEAITVTMFYTGGDRHETKPVDKFTPTFRNLHFSDISVNGAKQAILIEGLAEMPIRGLSVNNFNQENAEIGLTCVNAIGVSLSNLVIDSQKGPVYDIDSVTNVELLRVSTTKPRPSDAIVRFSNVPNAGVQLCSAPEGAKALLELKGSANRNVAMIGNRFPAAEQAVIFADGATKAAITKES
jgi:hypothetical protein